jgi:glucokinase
MSDIKHYRGGSAKVLNELNMSAVLDRIRRGKEVSKSSLSREMNLSLPAISRIVATLIKQKYVLEVGPGKSSGGKRPTILRFHAERSYVIGIGVDIGFIDIMLADLSGNEKKTIYKKFPADREPKEMINIIVEYIDRIVEETKIDRKKLEAISIGVPAMIENKTGLVKLCPSIPDWEGMNLSKVLSEKVGKDVFVDNEANLSLLGEKWKGKAKGLDNVVFIGMETGIGAGILINGKLFRGSDGSAGEIGYMYIDKNIDREPSYPYGQFEYLACNTSLRRELEKSGLCENRKEKGIADLVQDNSIRTHILEIVDHFAFGIANLIAVLNPELIVIRGELFYESDYCFNYLKDKVDSLTTFKARIARSALKERAVTFGAVKLGIAHLDKKILSPFFH